MQASGLTAWELFCRRGERLLFGSLDLWADKGDAIRLAVREVAMAVLRWWST